jgi:hypothetical protein
LLIVHVYWTSVNIGQMALSSFPKITQRHPLRALLVVPKHPAIGRTLLAGLITICDESLSFSPDAVTSRDRINLMSQIEISSFPISLLI